jgi:Fe-S oxidoreductase
MNNSNSVDSELYRELAKYGARDMEICMQCGTCSASCPLSSGTNPFPRKIYRYIQLGLKDKLLKSTEPWLCYYCGDCNKDCPRGAEPAETMMATRRWLIAEYDWTGLAGRIYLSATWELGAFLFVALGIIILFYFGHGPVVTEHVELNTFAPVAWIKFGDKCMLSILGVLLLSNGFRMYRYIMGETKPPLLLYPREAKTFILHYFTQKRWRDCGEERRNRWLRHVLLFSGYVTMEVLVVAFLSSFQTDVIHPMWHPTRVFGYYAAIVLMVISAEMMISRYQKKEDLHRYSDFTDWFFLILLFMTAFSGLLVHIFRLAGWPLMTYSTYVVHLSISVGMLCVMLPFGKLSHLFYRPLAIFLATVREKATKDSRVDVEELTAQVGETFMSCLQCGSCTSLCPWTQVSSYSPRRILRQLALDVGSEKSVDLAVWDCVTCNACVVNCPRGIEIIDVIEAVRTLNVSGGRIPESFAAPIDSLRAAGNPWLGDRRKRLDWAGNLELPGFTPAHEYCLFTCCTTAYDPVNRKAGQALVQLLAHAGVSFGTLGTEESCCGDPARKMGASDNFSELADRNTTLFLNSGVKKILTTSPHCLNAFKNNYSGLKVSVASEHYSVLLDRFVGEGRLRPILEVAATVTYHDPCYLGRYNGIYTEPRRVLQSIPGLTLVEMPNNRDNSLCCGGGGGGTWGDSPRNQRFGVLRVEEALASGAEVIVTACPYCLRMLYKSVGELGVKDQIAVRDLAQLLWQSVMMDDEENMMARIDLAVGEEVCYV